MKKPKEKYITTRTIYKAVKKYDHTQFDDFCTMVYKQGYSDGRESVPGADVTDVMEAIKAVKGIGEKRLAQIQEAVETVFGKKKGETENE